MANPMSVFVVHGHNTESLAKRLAANEAARDIVIACILQYFAYIRRVPAAPPRRGEKRIETMKPMLPVQIRL
jgi:hypothetical protein